MTFILDHKMQRLTFVRKVHFSSRLGTLMDHDYTPVFHPVGWERRISKPDTSRRSDKGKPVYHLKEIESASKPLENFLNENAVTDLAPVESVDEKLLRTEIAEIAGIPDRHMNVRRARIFMPARTATQSGWAQTGIWKIELDTQERWENPCIGYASSGDQLSNLSGWLDFASREDAIRFCEKRCWTYEIIEPQERKILPKSYGANFNWNKRTRVGTK